jgi:hypothetical protein
MTVKQRAALLSERAARDAPASRQHSLGNRLPPPRAEWRVEPSFRRRAQEAGVGVERGGANAVDSSCAAPPPTPDRPAAGDARTRERRASPALRAQEEEPAPTAPARLDSADADVDPAPSSGGTLLFWILIIATPLLVALALAGARPAAPPLAQWVPLAPAPPPLARAWAPPLPPPPPAAKVVVVDVEPVEAEAEIEDEPEGSDGDEADPGDAAFGAAEPDAPSLLDAPPAPEPAGLPEPASGSWAGPAVVAVVAALAALAAAAPWLVAHRLAAMPPTPRAPASVGSATGPPLRARALSPHVAAIGEESEGDSGASSPHPHRSRRGGGGG